MHCRLKDTFKMCEILHKTLFRRLVYSIRVNLKNDANAFWHITLHGVVST